MLYGAGTIGGLIARQLHDKGERDLVFADNDRRKNNTVHEGIQVVTPSVARSLYPEAKWVATVHRDPNRLQILKHIEEMGVESISLYDFLPARKDLPSFEVFSEVVKMCNDELSMDFLWDQYEFRTHGKSKMVPADIKNVYFEDFYTRLDTEHYVDCGAFDGDMVVEFTTQWGRVFEQITAFEPDSENFQKLIDKYSGCIDTDCHHAAIGDHIGAIRFSNDGDQTSHIDRDGSDVVPLISLDSMGFVVPPTLIKMDIEGYEKEGLWGARNIIKEHSPVLAICAYHKGPDLWEIPLLIHSLNPNYKLYFRRYLEATWELIWYAVPPERVK